MPSLRVCLYPIRLKLRQVSSPFPFSVIFYYFYFWITAYLLDESRQMQVSGSKKHVLHNWRTILRLFGFEKRLRIRSHGLRYKYRGIAYIAI